MKIILKDNSDKYDPRFIIVDDEGNTVDDAQGFGYKSREKAAKAMWYKFKGGKTKLDKQGREKKILFKKHKGLNEFICKIRENNFKEISRGEVTNQDISDAVKEEFGIDIPEEYLN